MTNDFDRQVSGIAALGEPIRRALYRFVVRQGRPVSRDEAAEGLRVARHVAKFHLDRLEEDGLLDVEFSRPPGRTGPGAGRPTKRYFRSKREMRVSIPERRYDLAGHLMAQAIEDAQERDVPVGEALHEAAFAMGRELAVEARERAGEDAGPEELLEAARAVIDERGYESRESDGRVILANCPFHSLAQDYTDLVCGMNVDLMRGLFEGLGAGIDVRLDPAPDRCCVTLGVRS